MLTANMPLKRADADEFVKECYTLFDKVYLNTAVPECKARNVMKEQFNISDIGYWKWKHDKTEGYEELMKGNAVVHVEDGVDYVEREEMHRLGVHYVEINPDWDEDEGELKKALESMRKIVGK